MSYMFNRYQYYIVDQKQAPAPLPLTIELTDEFQIALSSLPNQYDNSTAKAFRDFFSVYGTHVATRVGLGGAAIGQTFTHSCMEYTDVEHSHAEEKSSFFILFESAGHGQGYNKTDRVFEEWPTSYVSLMGGSPDPFGLLDSKRGDQYRMGQKECYTAWEKSILDKGLLAPVWATLQPIHTFFLRDGNQAGLQAAFGEALADYVEDVGAVSSFDMCLFVFRGCHVFVYFNSVLFLSFPPSPRTTPHSVVPAV